MAPLKPGHLPVSPLGPAFFDRPAEAVARDLVGARLVRRDEETTRTLLIEETEAYLGPHDLACHSARGRTRSNTALFGAPGDLYVYLVYGLHLLLNVVTGPTGLGAAVLIRSAGGIKGPGRLGRDLRLTLDLSGRPSGFATGIWFLRRDAPVEIVASPRIGVGYAGAEWSQKPLRFTLAPPLTHV